MQLPDSVRRQGEEARKLQEGLKAPPPAAGGNGHDTTTVPQAGELETLRAENTRLQAAHSVLQGKYNAEVPRLATQVREINAKLEQANAEAEKLRQSQEQARQQAVDHSKLDLTQYYTADEINERGEDDLRAELARSMRIANSLVSNQVTTATENLRKEIAPIKEDAERERERRAQEQATAREMAEARLVAELNVAIPKWRDQNEDPGFHSWLDMFDSTQQRSRKLILQEAHSQMDTAKVIEVFKAYRENREIGVAMKTPQPKLDPGPGSGDNTPPQQQEKRKWTRAEIAQFNHDAGPGRKYIGRDAERRQIEADIQSANREGRIIG